MKLLRCREKQMLGQSCQPLPKTTTPMDSSDSTHIATRAQNGHSPVHLGLKARWGPADPGDLEGQEDLSHHEDQVAP